MPSSMGKSPTILSVLREGPGDAGAFRHAPGAGDLGRAGAGAATAAGSAKQPAGAAGALGVAGLAAAMDGLKLSTEAGAPGGTEGLFVEEDDGLEEGDEEEEEEEDEEGDGMGGGVFDIQT
jgi:hypothetical protein